MLADAAQEIHMAYTITRSNGTTITVSDNALDTTYSVTLVGKNRTNYGAPLNQNFFRLMENFAAVAAPANPQAGQLWWNTQSALLNVFSGSAWKPVSSIFTSNQPPAERTLGDLWFDTLNQQLRVWSGSSWFVIGPTGTATSGVVGFVTEQVPDSAPAVFVASMFVSNTRIAVLSANSVATSWTGFSTLNPGINYNTAVTSVATWNGNVNGVSANFTANVNAATVAVTGNLTAGNVSTAGRVAAGNITVTGEFAANLLVANTVTANTSLSAANISVTGAAALNTVTANISTVSGNSVANNITANNITSNSNLSTSNFTATGLATLGSVANVRITGGSNAQVLSTDGTGNLSWTTVAAGAGSGTVSSGTANLLAFYASSGTTVSNATGLSWNISTANLGVTGNIAVTGNVSANRVTVTTFNSSGNANVGNLGVTGIFASTSSVTGNSVANNVSATNNISANSITSNTSFTSANLSSSGTASFTGNLTFTGTVANLGTVANVRITGGTSGQVLSTDGTGVLSWVPPATGGGSGTVASGTATQLAFYASTGDTVSATGTNLTWNNVSTVLTVTGNISTGNISASGAVASTGAVTAATLSVTGNTAISTSSGAVAIGASAAAAGYKLDVVNTGANAVIRSSTGTVGTVLQSAHAAELGAVGTHTNHALQIISNNTERMRVLSTGNVGIANTAPAHTLSITGTLNASGNISTAGEFIATSDARVKTDFEPIGSALDLLQSITGYRYTRTDLNTVQLGLVAQEVQQVLPETVKDSAGLLGISYMQLIAVLVQAVKELHEKVNHVHKTN